MIMAGKPLNYKKDLALEFGAYCQVHAHHTPRNSMKARTEAGICLGPIGNEQGGFKFMSLQSGRKFTAHKWTQLPIPPEVIKRVNFLGKDQPKDLIIFDKSGVAIEDDDDALIAEVDGTDDDDLDDDQDITDEFAEIAEQDETEHAIREAGGEVVELQELQQFDTPTPLEPAVETEQELVEMPTHPTDDALATRRSNCGGSNQIPMSQQ